MGRIRTPPRDDLLARSRLLRDRSDGLCTHSRALRAHVQESVRRLRGSRTPQVADPARDLRTCDTELGDVLDALAAESGRVEAERARVRRALAALGPRPRGRKASVLRFVSRRRKR